MTAQTDTLVVDRAATAAWFPAFLASAVMWGASFLFVKIAVDGGVPPAYVATGRTAAGALTLIAIVYLRSDRLPRDLRFWLHMIVPAVFGMVLPFSLFAYGEQRVSSVVAGIWNATTALWVLPFAVFVYRTETVSVRKMIGLGTGFAGVATVLGFWHAGGGASWSGQLMCGAAPICYGVCMPYLKRYVTSRRTESGVTLAAGQLLVAAVLLMIVSPLVAGAPPDPIGLSWKVIAAMATLGVFGSGVAFALNMRVIAIKGASTSAFVTYVVPVVSTLLGVIVLQERITWNLPVGMAIVLVSVAYAQDLLWRRRSVPQLSPVPVIVAGPGVEPGSPPV